MKRVILAIALSGVFAVPAFAQDSGMAAEKMSCAEFTAMDADGQMKAVETMQMASDNMASGEMKSGEMTSGQMEMGQTSSGEMKSGEMASGDSMMSDDMVAAVAKACEGHPDMMAMDAMKETSAK